VALLPLARGARGTLLPDTSWALLAWIVVAANPLLLYALEFWEHAPAVALLAAHGPRGGAGACRRRLDGAWRSAARSWRRRAAAARRRVVRRRARAGARAPPWLPFGGGAAALLLPAAALQLRALRQPARRARLGGARADRRALPRGALAARARLAVAGVGRRTRGLALVAAAWLAALGRVDLRARQLLALAGTAIVALLAARRDLPEEAFLQGFPLALLALVPAATWTRQAGQLALAALVAVAGVVLTATNDGGAQWGTRYLLIAAPPLLLLAAHGATQAAASGAWRTPRLALLAVILLAGAMTSRDAYVELRGTKRNYAGLVAEVSAVAPPRRHHRDQRLVARSDRRRAARLADVSVRAGPGSGGGCARRVRERTHRRRHARVVAGRGAVYPRRGTRRHVLSHHRDATPRCGVCGWSALAASLIIGER
jgi:hypothetical protein